MKASRYLGYLLTLLLLVNIFNFIDRQLPFILAQAIKRDLQLSDTQIGLLGGVAFSLLYPFLGLPLARMADRYGHKLVLGISLLVWSAITSLTGFSMNFAQLCAARIGVSIGEAGATPAGHALIAAHYPLHRRGLPLALFSLGVPIGSMLALVLGGWIMTTVGWRGAFVWAGLPGLILALLMFLFVREPTNVVEERSPNVGMWQTTRRLLGKPTFRQLAFAMGPYSMSANAMIVFTPAFLMRSHHLDTLHTGLWLGLIYGTAGVAGVMTGGVVADRLGTRDPRWRVWAPALAMLVAVPCTLFAWMVGSTALCIALLVVPKFCNLVYPAPIFAAAQTLVPRNARAVVSSLLLLFNSFIGLAFGPLLVGVLSDHLAPRFGDDALRYALLAIPVLQLWSVLHFALAAPHLTNDIDPSAQADEVLA
jgi:MFS family permease